MTSYLPIYGTSLYESCNRTELLVCHSTDRHVSPVIKPDWDLGRPHKKRSVPHKGHILSVRDIFSSCIFDGNTAR